MPEPGAYIDPFIDRVSDLGIPLSDPGATLSEELDSETEKRNQDLKDLHIVSDWNGYGVSEVMCNMMKEFDKVVFKKTVSPYKKWAYVEALASFLKAEAGSVSMAYWVGESRIPRIPFFSFSFPSRLANTNPAPPRQRRRRQRRPSHRDAQRHDPNLLRRPLRTQPPHARFRHQKHPHHEPPDPRVPPQLLHRLGRPEMRMRDRPALRRGGHQARRTRQEASRGQREAD